MKEQKEKTLAEKAAWGVLKAGFTVIAVLMSAAIGKSTKKF